MRPWQHAQPGRNRLVRRKRVHRRPRRAICRCPADLPGRDLVRAWRPRRAARGPVHVAGSGGAHQLPGKRGVRRGRHPAGPVGGVRPADWRGRWWRRRGVGGTIPVRFPSQDDPGDAGWHIEASFEKNGDWWVNYRSRQRGLLALYLFSDVDADCAPTRVRPGSHRDAARVLRRPVTKGCRSRRRRSWPRRPARTGRRPWRPAGPGTSSSATRSWSTPRRGRTRAAAEDHGPARRRPARRVPAGPPAEPSRARHDR